MRYTNDDFRDPGGPATSTMCPRGMPPLRRSSRPITYVGILSVACDSAEPPSRPGAAAGQKGRERIKRYRARSTAALLARRPAAGKGHREGPSWRRDRNIKPEAMILPPIGCPRQSLVMPYHKVIDGLEEKLKGNLGAGTTLRGIGPSFEDKVGRFGIRMCDLVDPVALREKLETIVPIKQRLIEAYGGADALDAEALYKEQAEYGARLAPFVADTSAWLDGAIRRRKRLLFEGAQGTLLCIR